MGGGCCRQFRDWERKPGKRCAHDIHTGVERLASTYRSPQSYKTWTTVLTGVPCASFDRVVSRSWAVQIVKVGGCATTTYSTIYMYMLEGKKQNKGCTAPTQVGDRSTFICPHRTTTTEERERGGKPYLYTVHVLPRDRAIGTSGLWAMTLYMDRMYVLYVVVFCCWYLGTPG